MKNLLIALLAGFLPCAALADGTPTAPASQTEVNAGTVTHKYVSPAALNGATLTGLNLVNPSITSPTVVGPTNIANASESAAGLMPTNAFIRQEWIQTQQDGFARTPILGIAGWFGAFNNSSWTNSVGGISNALWRANQTLYPYGYRYIWLDDGWGNTNLDANNLMQVSPEMQFTFGSGTIGVSNLIHAIHTNGWKVAFYLDGGTNLSSAGLQHGMGGALLWTNVATLVRYGADGFKSIQYQQDEERLAGILSLVPHPVFLLSLANGNYGALYPTMCNSFLTMGGTDVTSYTNVILLSDIVSTNELWRWVRPGHFVDMDYLGAEQNNNGGPNALKTHALLCALFSANLYDDAGFGVGNSQLQWFTNAAILSVHQDPAVICAQRQFTTNNCDLYLKPLGTQNGPQYALGVVNRGLPATNVTLYFTNLNPLAGSTTWSAYDCVSNVWLFQNTNAFSVNLDTNDSCLWKIVPGYGVFTNIASVNWPDSETVNVVSNGTPILAYASIDIDASNYIARAGTITNSQTEMLAACEAVALGKQNGWWKNLDALYLFRGSTSNSCAQNLISSSYGIKWTGGVTYSWQGVTGDGATGFGDTQFTPSTASGKFSLNSASLFVYNQTANPTPTVAARFIGVSGGTAASILINGNQIEVDGLNTTALTADGFGTNGYTYNFSGSYLVSRTGSATQNVYHGPQLGFIDTSSATGLPTSSIYLLAQNASGLWKPVAATLSAASIGGGMTSDQWTTFRTDMNTVENILRLNIP
jgi:hypothetical protein